MEVKTEDSAYEPFEEFLKQYDKTSADFENEMNVDVTA